MTKPQFWSQFKRLSHAFPHKFMTTDPNSLANLFSVVEEFSESWLSSKIDRMMRENNPDLSIIDAAKAECKSQASYQRALEAAKPTVVDYESLDRVLKEANAESLWELVIKTRAVSN